MQRVLLQVVVVIVLGLGAMLLTSYYSAYTARTSTWNSVALLFGHVHNSTSETPDLRIVDPGDFSFRARFSNTPPDQMPVPTGWLGYVCGSDSLRYGWAWTGVIAVKERNDENDTLRVAERCMDNYFGHFPRWSSTNIQATSSDDRLPYVTEYAFGWPERSLMLRVRYDHISNTPQPFDSISLPLIDRIAGRASTSPGSSTLYPVRPIWPGLLINTLVLGIVADRLLSWFFIPPVRWYLRRAFWVHRERRRDRGLCPLCKYTLKGSPTCSECGWTGDSTHTRFSVTAANPLSANSTRPASPPAVDALTPPPAAPSSVPTPPPPAPSSSPGLPP